jgi:hypothetical protein
MITCMTPTQTFPFNFLDEVAHRLDGVMLATPRDYDLLRQGYIVIGRYGHYVPNTELVTPKP